MRWESRAYGTREEIEEVLKNAYEAPGCSPGRHAEAEAAGKAFLRGETEIKMGHTIYIVADE